MRTRYLPGILLLIISVFIPKVNAQTGKYDVRFNFGSFDCNSLEAFVDIEIKASHPDSTFLLADQNYRYTFQTSIIDPVDPITGSDPNPSDQSVGIETQYFPFFFDPNTGMVAFYEYDITGSSFNQISTNINRTGGDTGVPIGPDDWVKAAGMRLNLKSPSCLELDWNTDLEFPPTTITEFPAGGGVPIPVPAGSFENFNQCFTGFCDPLSVDLFSFSGESRECEVSLHWQTQSEINNDYFIVEKSTNGIDFTEIGRVRGHGTTSNQQEYYFSIRQIDPLNYYRLSQIDYDGVKTSFETIPVESSCFENLDGQTISNVFPNPIGSGNLYVKITATQDDANTFVVIHNAFGQLIDMYPVSIMEGNNLITYPVNKLAAGMYSLQIQFSEGYSRTQKFVYLNP